MSRRLLTKPQTNKRDGMPAGVYRYIRTKTLRTGPTAEYLYFSTHTVENGRKVVKCFSCGALPVSRATEQARKAEAIAYRLALEASVHADALGVAA